MMAMLTATSGKPLLSVRLRRTAAAGGFRGTTWSRGSVPAVMGIVDRFLQTRRNDDAPMFNQVHPFKDWVVMIGKVSDSHPPICAAVRARDPLPRDGSAFVRVALDSTRPIEPGDWLRVTGVVCLDQSHSEQVVELHPVYSVERFQDWTKAASGELRSEVNADLSGVWHSSDGGTFYLR